LLNFHVYAAEESGEQVIRDATEMAAERWTIDQTAKRPIRMRTTLRA